MRERDRQKERKRDRKKERGEIEREKIEVCERKNVREHIDRLIKVSWVIGSYLFRKWIGFRCHYFSTYGAGKESARVKLCNNKYKLTASFHTT